MAFPDTITFTINAVAKVLTKVKEQDYSSEYRLTNPGVDQWRAFVRHTTYKDKVTGRMFDRHTLELTQTVQPVAPSEIPMTRKWYTVLENQQVDTIVDPVKFAFGASAFLTEANWTKLVNYES